MSFTNFIFSGSAPLAVITGCVIVGCFGNGECVAVRAFNIAFHINWQQLHLYNHLLMQHTISSHAMMLRKYQSSIQVFFI